MSSGSASIRCAASRVALSLTFTRLIISAAPPTAVFRLPKVPTPVATTLVSPWRTTMSSIGTPNSSAASCAKLVSWPCPCGDEPVSTVTLPLASTRTVPLSQPAAGSAAEGPMPHISVYVETPIPT